MLLWLLETIQGISAPGDESHLAAVLGKITLRAALAALFSFLLTVLSGPRWIGWLKARFLEPNVSPSDRLRELHAGKQATPTMGGLFIVLAIVAASVLLADLDNRFVQLALGLLIALTTLGAIDDLTKLRSRRRGLSARGKLLGQCLITGLIAVACYRVHAERPEGLVLSAPGLGTLCQMGWWLVPLAAAVIVGASNATNLTDGLDGLAGGSLIWSVGAMAVACYIAGHAELAAYLHVPAIPGAGEMTVIAGATLGGLLGFLWFNCHPAQVFMGDTGSLPLGGLLGLLAVVARQELLLVVVAGVLVAEAVSVILQVAWFRCTGRRIFRCAPLHHHFQFLGWPESKIVVRFWIASALCALAGIGGLKLSSHESTSPAVTAPPALARQTIDLSPVSVEAIAHE